MKNRMKHFLFAATGMLALFAFNAAPGTAEPVPDEVKDLLKSACYDCHSDGATGDKAKKALDFDQWDDYRVTKRIAKLEAICETLEEDKMPPAKYLKSKPEKKLSEKDKEKICEWTARETVRLMEGQ